MAKLKEKYQREDPCPGMNDTGVRRGLNLQWHEAGLKTDLPEH